MPDFDKQKWVKEIIEEVARDYNILLSPDDPVLVTAILNQKLLSRFYDQQNDILNQFEKTITEQYKIQHQNNQKILDSVSNKLIENTIAPRKVSKPPTLVKPTYSKFITYSLFLIFGIVLGYIINI